MGEFQLFCRIAGKACNRLERRRRNDFRPLDFLGIAACFCDSGHFARRDGAGTELLFLEVISK